MSYQPLFIEPFKSEHDPEILAIEKSAAQGSIVKIEMLRDSFLSRASVLPLHQEYIARNIEGQLVGAVIGAGVPIEINGTEHLAGFGLDLRVSSNWKNRGAGTQMLLYVVNNFFKPNHLKQNFMIVKSSNKSMLKLLMKFSESTSLTSFEYLVIPVSKRIKKVAAQSGTSRIEAKLFHPDPCHTNFYTIREGGIGVWHTYKTYTLDIKSINPLLRLGIQIAGTINGKKYPRSGEKIKPVTLFNLKPENLHCLPELMSELEQLKVNYIHVVCQKNDVLFQALRSHAVFSYSHYLITDFPVLATDSITIDVRCL